METVVITGGSRGFGAGLARAFLQRGHKVVICGRNADPDLAAQFQDLQDGLFYVALDVSHEGSADRLWDQAVERFGRVDCWINNAGMAYGGLSLQHAQPAVLQAMVSTNVLGTLLGCRAAVTGMGQQGVGAIYNIYGAGSDGQYIPTMVAYGATKRAVDYLTRSLASEMLASGIIVGGLSPGLMMTEPVLGHLRRLSGPALAARLKVVNLIADHVETVAEWAVEKMLTNRQTGRVFSWLTRPRILARKAAGLWHARDVASRYGLGVNAGD